MIEDFTINEFPALNAPHVHMKDEKGVLRTINKILRDGAKNLQVVTDYDRTITKQHVEGRKNLSSFGIFEQSSLLSNEFKEECKKMAEIYRPIETDESLPMDVRIKAMEKWWEGSNRVLKGLNIPLDEIDRLVAVHGSELRDNTRSLFQRLNNLEVPILVFSAGLGDVIEVMLKKNYLYFDNVKIVSNFLKYEDNIIQGFKNEKKLIHVFNKNEHAVEGDEYFQVLKQRHNGLLMGDTTGDANMTDGIEHFEEVLKIGFLYEESEQNLPNFMKKFDIVLEDDQTMNVPLEIINKLV